MIVPALAAFVFVAWRAFSALDAEAFHLGLVAEVSAVLLLINDPRGCAHDQQEPVLGLIAVKGKLDRRHKP